MNIVERRIADVVVVAPAGPIDHPNAQQLERALAPILARDATDTAGARPRFLVASAT